MSKVNELPITYNPKAINLSTVQTAFQNGEAFSQVRLLYFNRFKSFHKLEKSLFIILQYYLHKKAQFIYSKFKIPHPQIL